MLAAARLRRASRSAHEACARARYSAAAFVFLLGAGVDGAAAVVVLSDFVAAGVVVVVLSLLLLVLPDAPLSLDTFDFGAEL